MGSILQIITKLFQSKTLILNWITLIVGVLAAVSGSEIIKDYPDVAAGILSAVGALNLVLRYLTTLPLAAKESISDKVTTSDRR